ncbi:MAG: 3'(2'), 5'-bisphosphate nucleotidase [Alphaproteobacteria bacterium]|jgi:3'(2'), 5'-bisphosphate nucleotidase
MSAKKPLDPTDERKFMENRAELLAHITRLAEEAGALILEIYNSNFDVRQKGDGSPVTMADEAAEAHIMAGLRELTPDIPAVGEEESSQGISVDIGSGPFWLVDPLDGTNEFVNRRDEFTVNIGLIEDGQPTIGVVHAPAKDVTYAGAGPGTATRRQGTEPAKPIHARSMPATGAVVTASRAHGDQKKIQQLMDARSINRMIITGSSIKFCLIAAGEADIYPRYGHTREWDTAAAHAVLAAAGGTVRTLAGDELKYGKDSFLNPEFIAQGRDS